MTYTEISEVVLAAPGIEWGVIQHTHRLIRTKSHRVPGGADSWIFKQLRKSYYRVVLGDEERAVDLEAEDMMSAVRAAFVALGKPLPEALTK
jgi:hypothetical protein